MVCMMQKVRMLVFNYTSKGVKYFLEPDVIPLQLSGSIDTDMTMATSNELMHWGLANLWGNGQEDGYAVRHGTRLLKSHMHLTQYVDQVCIICGSVKVTLCPLTSSVDGVCTCTTPSTHISVDLVIVL